MLDVACLLLLPGGRIIVKKKERDIGNQDKRAGEIVIAWREPRRRGESRWKRREDRKGQAGRVRTLEFR